MTPDPLLDSLRAAVSAAPGDVPLRLHLAGLLLERGGRDEAVAHLGALLGQDPGNAEAAQLMARALTGTPVAEPKPGFDWAAAESQVADVVSPRFVDGAEAVPTGPAPAELTADVEQPRVTLADVGGMTDVKKRLDAAFLAPMRNPELRKLYGKSLRGGLLLYGPPGNGKTFLAKAVAGELRARFLAVGLDEVLDMWLGNSERNLHELFLAARRAAPCVVFFDELDAIGQKRSRLAGAAARNVVAQLLVELDGVTEDNEGVFVLAATNAPWDVDTALRRPGRFDRTLLVLPPDEPARAAILEYHLRDRPVAGIDLKQLAKRTDGWSGADLAHLCETASERALLASVESGVPREIGMADLLGALPEIRPSAAAWFAAARNVVLYANADGAYDELAGYLKRKKLL
ncbi:ATP-binding protein [Amycolatopsis sp. OK19-0408]|uniref:ATP-binding protein n=1 Tax=Amycolatopsis iheyensis TaxID=2945988 RepID=A0A9X2NJK9_9PSEU|nr:ATP-binding protein [Amycolatopsis iheyensis]MCR6486060.1 ATP-binding protein [Amycolatopsis iheyensis]